MLPPKVFEGSCTMDTFHHWMETERHAGNDIIILQYYLHDGILEVTYLIERSLALVAVATPARA